MLNQLNYLGLFYHYPKPQDLLDGKCGMSCGDGLKLRMPNHRFRYDSKQPVVSARCYKYWTSTRALEYLRINNDLRPAVKIN